MGSPAGERRMPELQGDRKCKGEGERASVGERERMGGRKEGKEGRKRGK
jgi:hypothetical protein